MLRTLNPAMVRPRKFRKTQIKAWREHRKMTLEALAEAVDQTPSYLSMLERGQRGYTQETLEGLAAALRTDVGSLLTRSPTDDPESIWPIWDEAKPGQRRLIVDLAKSVLKTGS